MFVGFVDLEDTIAFAFTVRNASRSPVAPDTDPSFRVYGPDGLIATNTRLATKLDTVSISSVVATSPITVNTSSDHGFYTGDRITITGVGGITAANSTWTITKVDADTFTLDTSTESGTYTSGGTAHVAGLWQVSIDVLQSLGFERGVTYTVRVAYAVSGTNYVEEFSFQVT